MMGTCQECKFFESIEWSKAGKCHLFPPTSDKWAHVRDEDWCGQFQAADISGDDYDWVPTSGPPPLSPYSGQPQGKHPLYLKAREAWADRVDKPVAGGRVQDPAVYEQDLSQAKPAPRPTRTGRREI